jgi:DNA-binding response OmpR family regulator
MIPQALIFHSDRKTAEAGQQILCSSGYECAIAAGFEEALALVDGQRPQLCLLGQDAWTDSLTLERSDCNEPVVAITAFDTLEAAVHVLKTNSVVTAAEHVVEHVKQIVRSFGLAQTLRGYRQYHSE